jgi:CBS domain-containing protein
MEVAESVSSLLVHKPTADLWRVSPDDTVFDAIKLMSEKNIGALLVMVGDKLVGIVSERDYTRKVALLGRVSRETPVSEIMTAEVISIDPSTSVETAMELITANHVRHLPVVEDGHVIGIVSIGDLVKRIISAQEVMIGQLENFVTGAYPG